MNLTVHELVSQVRTACIGVRCCCSKQIAGLSATDKPLVCQAGTRHTDALAGLVPQGLEGLVLVLRSVYLLVLFTPAVVMAPFADMFGPRFRKLWLRVVHASLEQAGEQASVEGDMP
jgi:hypothetical protein